MAVALELIISKINNSEFSYAGEKVHVNAMDESAVLGSDTVSIHIMYRDPDDQPVLKQCYTYDRQFLTIHPDQALMQALNSFGEVLENVVKGEEQEI